MESRAVCVKSSSRKIHELGAFLFSGFSPLARIKLSSRSICVYIFTRNIYIYIYIHFTFIYTYVHNSVDYISTQAYKR